MKTFAKLFAVLAFLAVGFTSCGDDEDYTLTIDVEVSSTTGVVTGKVDASQGISTATLFLVIEDGRESISSFTAKNINNDGTFRIEGLANGNYELEVKDKDGNVKSKTFKVNVGTIEPVYETFTVTLGGSDATTAGSFLSIKDKKAYKSSEITSTTNNVEIIFTGTEFKSATESINANIKGNGNSATIVEAAGIYSFTTSTGYTGTLTITDGAANAASAVITVEAKRLSVE